MGSRALGEDFDEGPVHKVTLTRPMRMSATEITNAQYEEFFPGTPCPTWQKRSVG